MIRSSQKLRFVTYRNTCRPHYFILGKNTYITFISTFTRKDLIKISTATLSVRDFLRTVPLFADIPEKDMDTLVSFCKVVHKKKGSLIYRKEDSSNHLYLIQTGYVMESVFYGSSADIIVKIRTNRDYFGEMGILSNHAYPNTALALEDTMLITVPQSCFLDTVWNNASVCKVIIAELIDRLLNSAQNMVNAMYLDAPGRLASTVVNLTTSTQNKSMKVRITQSALAAASGMARQTAAKILGDWRKEGIISTERGRFCVLDFNRLLDIILESEIKN